MNENGKIKRYEELNFTDDFMFCKICRMIRICEGMMNHSFTEDQEDRVIDRKKD